MSSGSTSTSPEQPQQAKTDCVSTENLIVVDSAALFAGKNEIRVRHRGDEYRLRITRLGKLILTK